MFASDPGDPFGVFFLPRLGGRTLKILATDGADDPTCPPASVGWEHVSVSVAERGGATRPLLPTWEEMCAVKALFWEPEDCVVQYHPPESSYVNNAPVLHLWRCTSIPFPVPASILVGDAKLGILR
jgi:hypothetical protein